MVVFGIPTRIALLRKYLRIIAIIGSLSCRKMLSGIGWCSRNSFDRVGRSALSGAVNSVLGPGVKLQLRP